MKVILSLAFVALFPSPAAAGWISLGDGDTTCAEFMAHAANSSLFELDYYSWAQGYMTALNAARTDRSYADLGAKSLDDQKSYIKSFCDSNPDSKYVAAVKDLYSSLPVSAN
jgi:hypothetical protein